MKINIFAILFSLIVVVRCKEISLLGELSTIKFSQIFDGFSVRNFNDFKDISRNRVRANETSRGRDYDRDKCMIELGNIADGLSQAEMWALKLVDSWGKFPSGILDGNVHEFGSFLECLNIEQGGKKYETQYCLAQITAKIDGLFQPKSSQIEPRVAMPMPNANEISFTFGMCFPQSCSPIALTEILRRAIPQQIIGNISVNIKEDHCQFEETPSDIRLIDWIAIGILSIVFCLMIASTWYDIYCIINEKPKKHIFLAFSVYTNGRRLLSSKKYKSKDVMDCVHGIRVISTQWVVLGHTYMMFFALPSSNGLSFITNFVKQYHSMYLLSAFISVDTFFMLSGLFASHIMLKHLEKTKGKINIPLLYFHRFLRLTPLLAVAVLLTMSLVRYMGSGPIWPMLIDMQREICEEEWYTTLSYIQNYVYKNDICLGHSWYLAVDTQLFLLSPFIVYGIYRFRTKFLYLLAVFVALCVGCTITTFVSLDYAHTKSLVGEGRTFSKTYYPTHLRYSSWLVGLIFGAILSESRKRKVKLSKNVNLGGWLLTFASMATVIFANYPLMQFDSQASSLEYALYASLSRVIWSIALSYIIFACVHGYGGPVNWFLSLSLWQPLSRLSYSIYILHFLVLMVVMGSAKSTREASELFAFHAFFGIYIIAIFVSIIGSLAFESPILIIEKIMFSNGGKSREHNESTTKSPSPNETA